METGALRLYSSRLQIRFICLFTARSHFLGENETMNTRSRFTLSTVLSLAVVGLCVGSAQAQSGKKMKSQNKMMQKQMMDNGMMDDSMTYDSMMYEMAEPAPLGYPEAAPGGLHLYHYDSYALEGMSEGSMTTKQMEMVEMHDKMVQDRLMHEDSMMDEMMGEMAEPAPIDYPASAPGALHLYHYDSYAYEGMAEGSMTTKQMEMMEKHDKMVQDRLMHEDSMMENEDMMVDPAPIGYPFAAPGGLHLYHYTDYSQEGVEEGSSTVKKMDNMEKMDKKKMKSTRMSK